MENLNKGEKEDMQHHESAEKRTINWGMEKTS